MPRFAAPYVRNFAEILDTVGLLEGSALVPVEIRPRAMIRAMADWLKEQGQAVHVVDPTEEEWPRVREKLLTLPTTPKSLVVMVGTSEATRAVREGLTYVNHRRDSVMKHLGCPLLWCGPPEFLNLTAEKAPDFWSIREIPQRIEVEPNAFDLKLPRLVEPTTTTPDQIRPLFEAAKTQGDRPNTARLGLRLARGLVRAGQLEEAEREARDAKALFEAMDRRGDREVAECEEVLGDVEREREKVEEARGHYHKMREVAEQLRDSYLTARAYHRLGMAAQAGRKLDSAEEWYKKALGLLGTTGDDYQVARAHDDLAAIAWERKEFDASEEYSHKALTIFEKQRHEYDIAKTYVRLGGIAQARFDFDSALRFYEKARATFEKQHDKRNVAETHRLIGDARFEAKDFVAAKASYESALSALDNEPDSSKLLIHERLEKVERALGNQAAADAWQEKAHPGEKVRAIKEQLRRAILWVLMIVLLALFGSCTLGLGSLELCSNYEGERACRVSCSFDDAVSCETLGDIYRDGRHGLKDEGRARLYYDKTFALLEGDCEPSNTWNDQNRISCAHLKRLSRFDAPGRLPGYEARAAAFQNRACAARDAEACTELSRYLERMQPADRTTGLETLRRACRSRTPTACHELERLGEHP